jgi:hypothetical protein
MEFRERDSGYIDFETLDDINKDLADLLFLRISG